MGRTNPTYRDALTAIEREWGDYRRALRRRDRPHFDRLFAHAREHADAAGALNHTDPVVPLLLSVTLAQERRIAALAERLERLEGDEYDDSVGDAADPTTATDRSTTSPAPDEVD